MPLAFSERHKISYGHEPARPPLHPAMWSVVKWCEDFLRQLERRRPAHAAVIDLGGVSSAADGKHVVTCRA